MTLTLPNVGTCGWKAVWQFWAALPPLDRGLPACVRSHDDVHFIPVLPVYPCPSYLQSHWRGHGHVSLLHLCHNMVHEEACPGHGYSCQRIEPRWSGSTYPSRSLDASDRFRVDHANMCVSNVGAINRHKSHREAKATFATKKHWYNGIYPAFQGSSISFNSTCQFLLFDGHVHPNHIHGDLRQI